MRVFGRMLSLLIHLEDRPFSPSWFSSPVKRSMSAPSPLLGREPVLDHPSELLLQASTINPTAFGRRIVGPSSQTALS